MNVILMGNPADGFIVIGPFNHMEDAQKYLWGEPNNGENMWIVELHAPAEEDDK